MYPLTIERHGAIDVVRDDLIPGGTKRRYADAMVANHDEIVYASPCFGGAQVALALAGRAAGTRITIFCAARHQRHPRTESAAAAGATIVEISPGYLSAVRAAAHRYCDETGAFDAAFGLDTPETVGTIAAAAAQVPDGYDEVWCAGGSGTLARGLQAGIRADRFFVVRVGRVLTNPGCAEIIDYPKPFAWKSRLDAPFPSCPNYDRKAWEVCLQRSSGRVLFWNVMG